MPNQTNIPLQEFNKGGLADSKWSGVKNSFYKLTGLDLHSTPGLVQVAPKLSEHSGTTVDAYCAHAVLLPDGVILWFSFTDGKIWKVTTAGVWSLVSTTTAGAGGVGCFGAAYYNGYIYWATEARLHRVAYANYGTWDASRVLNWATFTNTDNLFHPMLVNDASNVLYIGDGNYVAQVDQSTFTANALDIPQPLRVRSLGQFGTDLLIGTWVGESTYNAKVFRWNTWSVSFTNTASVEETGVNAFFNMDNRTFAQIGMNGNIYQYNGETLDLYRKIPGTYNSTDRWYAIGNCVAKLNGRVLFAPSYQYGSSIDQGIYQIARFDSKYPAIMDMPYVISERSAGAFVTSGIELGAIIVSGFNLYVAWKNGSTYGVDKLDYSTKLDGAYIESRVMAIDRLKKSSVPKISVPYYSLPADTSIAISTSKDYAAYVAETVVVDTMRNLVSCESSLEMNTLQVKLTFTTSGGTAPAIEYAVIEAG